MPHAAAPEEAAQPKIVVPSEAVLREDWLKGYFAGLAAGRKQQAKLDQAANATQPAPPPPAPASPPPAPPAPAPAPGVPPTNFVPEGPAQPVD
jgi:hypothetical protein